MTNKEAIKELQRLQSGECYDTEYINFECFEMAINALKREEQENGIGTKTVSERGCST